MDENSDTDPDLIEAGRLLFARPWTFVKGCVRITDLPPPDRTEVAFAGRSNVGKSSLINAVMGRTGLARTSNTPGRTRELNIFEAADAPYRIVDLPGYGFARAPKENVAEWTRLIHAYLKGRATLKRVYVLVDARHGPKPNDITLMNELDRAAVSYQIVLTKADKCGATALGAVTHATEKIIVKHGAAYPHLLVTSAEKNTGIEGLRAEIVKLG